MEVAASAVALGKSVTVVDRVGPLLDRLGPVLSDIVLTAAVIRFQYIGALALLFGFGRNMTYRGAEAGSVPVGASACNAGKRRKSCAMRSAS